MVGRSVLTIAEIGRLFTVALPVAPPLRKTPPLGSSALLWFGGLSPGLECLRCLVIYYFFLQTDITSHRPVETVVWTLNGFMQKTERKSQAHVIIFLGFLTGHCLMAHALLSHDAPLGVMSREFGKGRRRSFLLPYFLCLPDAHLQNQAAQRHCGAQRQRQQPSLWFSPILCVAQ